MYIVPYMTLMFIKNKNIMQSKETTATTTTKTCGKQDREINSTSLCMENNVINQCPS